MKNIYVSIIILFLTGSLYSQDTIRVYYDKHWKKIKTGEKYEYFRMITKQDKYWSVKDFYANGNLKMVGAYRNKRCTQKQGAFIYYFEDGNIDNKGNYVKKRREGIWNWYFEEGKMASEELYSKGKRVKALFWDVNGNAVDSTLAEHPPKFNGGDPNKYFPKYIREHLEYPEFAEFKKAQGVVRINFIIEKDGRLIDAKVVESVDYQLDRVALMVVESSPKWEPAKFHNRFVKAEFTVPINFSLDE